MAQVRRPTKKLPRLSPEDQAWLRKILNEYRELLAYLRDH
jgi:hypothetical protein